MPAGTFDAYAYARRVLLPGLGLQNHPFVIQRPGAGGTRSRALKIVIERAPTLLVRLFDDMGRARRNAGALRYLERLNLPAPRLKHADIHWSNRFFRSDGLPRYGTAETWIDGTRALEAPDEEEAALSVAGLLARYHGVSRTSWGRPTGIPEIRPYASTTLSAVSEMIQDLLSRGVFGGSEAAEAGARLAAWRGALMRIGTFSLVLNDANRRNFILTSEKETVAIDIRRISFEPCAEEVANALYHFCRHDEAFAARFLNTYVAAATPLCRETWERTGAFFTALNTLKRLHRRTGPDAAAIVDAAETPPGAMPGVDARTPQWKQALLTLPRPLRVWPEPGSAPPEGYVS